MAFQDFSRVKSLNNIPSKKVDEIIFSIQRSGSTDLEKNTKINAINRFAESNIPIEYWRLKMEKNFTGDPRLLNKYKEYTADIKSSYFNGKSICLAGSHGAGKQLCLETELPTPSGFVKLKDLKIGNQLFDEQGNICNVVELHPINMSPEAYQITFDDGSIVDACADHLWQTWTRNARNNFNNKPHLQNKYPKVVSTKEILRTLAIGPNQPNSNHSVECSKPLNYPEKELLVDPYVLGLWLGDGTQSNGNIETADIQMLVEINRCGYSTNIIPSTIDDGSKSSAYRIGDLIKNNEDESGHIGKLKFQLKQLKLLNNKHIPDDYLYGSYDQRLALLQGLLDSDGSCIKYKNVKSSGKKTKTKATGGAIEYCTVLPVLAQQTQQLIKSLGIKCNVNKNKSFLYDKQHKDRYRLIFTTTLPVFKLTRKLNNLRFAKKQKDRSSHRYIVSVKPIAPKPMRCITVDSPSHLFLITRSFIATHNTMANTCVLKYASLKGYTSLYTTISDAVAALTQSDSNDKFLAKRELTMVDFLVIDELDYRFFSSDGAKDLYGRTFETILRTRLQNKLPTLLATNSPNIKDNFINLFKDSLGSLFNRIEIFTVMPGEDFRKKIV